MLGGAFGHLDVWLLHHEAHTIGAFALVGMGAVFAGVVRVPITSVLIIFEMTGDYGLVLPLMVANMMSYGLARAVRPLPIYEALLAQDGVILPKAPSTRHPLEQLRVTDAMTLHVVSVHPRQTVRDALDAVAGKSFDAMPVVDDVGTVLGEVSVVDLRYLVNDPDRPVSTLMEPASVIARDTPLLAAIARMNDEGARHLHVVESASSLRLAGIITLSDVVHAHAKVSRVVKPATAHAEPSSRFSGHQARGMMVTAIVVDHGAKFGELHALFGDPDVRAVVVRGQHGNFGVILPEHLHGLQGESELENLFVASDLAVPALDVDPAADIGALAKAMAGDGAVGGGGGGVRYNIEGAGRGRDQKRPRDRDARCTRRRVTRARAVCENIERQPL
jgi:CBS domain-containing protein